MKNSFNQTYEEIKSAYDKSVITESLQICYEYVSKYRRIVVLFDSTAYEIRVNYKLDAREYNKDFSVRWVEKDHAIAWAKTYAKNRNINFGCLTVIEKIGDQKI